MIYEGLLSRFPVHGEPVKKRSNREGTMKTTRFALATLCLAGLAAAAAVQEAPGSYKRPNGDTVRVSVSGAKFYCQIVDGKQAGFEMCHGMSKTGASGRVPR